MFKKSFLSFLAVIALLFTGNLPSAQAVDGFELFSPYSGISVTPGETINYDMQAINDTGSIQDAELSVNGLPEGWDYNLTAGGFQVSQLTVQPGSPQSFALELDVPLEVEKGTYEFEVNATNPNGPNDSIPLSVTVQEEGIYQTEFTSEQPNLEGDSETEFRYQATLRNRTAEEQVYAMEASTPEEWSVQYESEGESVSSVSVPSNQEKTVTVIATPPNQIEAGDYSFDVTASAGGTSAAQTFEASVTGQFGLELSTPSGQLNTNVNIGGSRAIDLVVKNTGTIPVNEQSLSAQTPPNWEISFEPASIPAIEPGSQETVQAEINASDNAIAGDYVSTITVEGAQVSDSIDLRMSVQKTGIWGWISSAIILLVGAGIYAVIRRYGRR
ncbi:COG1470 family protein [Salibacterium aidingense]|uniref:COG1470 family protein n=1 Tax=Salibacterium aidingense TaxID=384933 RepID=UPI00040CA09A|nr:NEW3 domain-containing protein [Salibacterium aidingense]